MGVNRSSLQTFSNPPAKLPMEDSNKVHAHLQEAIASTKKMYRY